MDTKFSEASSAAISRPENRYWLDIQTGERVAVHISGEDTNGGYTIVEIAIASGCSVPPHFHRSEDEIFVILEGSLHFQCENDEFDAPSGTSVVIPKGAVHCWHNVEDTPARMLAIFAPGGVDRLFEEMAECPRNELDALARRYGTILVGPDRERP